MTLSAKHRIGTARVTLRRAALAEIITLRYEVLRAGLPPESAAFDGDEEPATRHFGAFLDDTGENVGCLSLMERPFEGHPAYQLRGMAARADVARRGIGTALLRFARQEFGPALLWCNARREAVPFYQRLGWTIASAEFDIPTAGPHYRMAAPVAPLGSARG